MSGITALVFPGQGSQRVGMLDAIPENDDLVRLMDAAEALSDMDLRTLALLGQDEDLADTRVAQPLLYLTDWAWGVALIESGIEPDYVAGHSLGELAALAIAGVFSVEAGLELVVERSRLMATTAASTSGAMAAVLGLDGAAVARAIDGIAGVWTANDNAPGQIVISGTEDGVVQATEALTVAGARRIVPLKVSGPFHSPLMEPAQAAFELVVSGADFHDADYPVIQNTAATPATDAQVIRDRLIAQITAPVRWTETMNFLAAQGPCTMVEAGPGSVLTGLARKVEGINAISAEASGIERVLEEVS